MRSRVLVGAVVLVIVLMASVAYYALLSRPTSPVLHEPSQATLVPPLVFAMPTADSDASGNLITRLVVDDVAHSGLGIDTQLFTGDENTVIYGKLYYGLVPGGYNAWDIGFNGLLGTSDRLVDPSTLLVRLVSKYSIGQSFNHVGYNNSQYDRLYNQQLSELDLAKRKFLVDWITQNYAENVARLTLGYPVATTAYNKDRVSGVTPYGVECLGNIWTYLNASSRVASDTFNVAVIVAGEGDVNPATYNFFTYTFRSTGLASMLFNGVFDNLLKSRPDGSVTPSLATGWKIINNTNIVVQLRSDSKWADGQLVTAQDVAFTFNYLTRYSQPVIFQPYLSAVDHVTALNSTAVQFVLKEPYAPFITNTLTQIPIIPQHIFDGLLEKQGVKNPSDLKLTPDLLVGSGPWKLVTWNYGSQVIFQSNPNYYIQPQYKYVKFVYFTSHQIAITALEQGQIDTLASEMFLSPAEIQEVRSSPSIQIVKIPTWSYWDLQINMRHLPGADRAFRLAFAHMVNYEKIVSVAFGGDFVRGVGFIAPMNTAWVNGPLVERELKTNYNYDLAAARKVLSDAGYQWDSNGKLHYPESLLAKGFPAVQMDNYNFAISMNQVISTVHSTQLASTSQVVSQTFPVSIPVITRRNNS